MPTPETAIKTAQTYIHAVESKDLQSAAQTLSQNVRQLFMHSSRTGVPADVDEIIAGNGEKGFCIALFNGKSEVLAYTEGLIGKFSQLVWRDHRWSASPDGRSVFFTGKGDMIVAGSSKPYRNTYVTVFHIHNDHIELIVEYADAKQYMGLGVAPNRAELKSFWRALVWLVSFRSGNYSAEDS